MRPRILLAYLIAVATVFAPEHASSQANRGQSMKIIVPFGPGGTADVNARILAQSMSELFGETIVIENRPGAGGIAAAETLSKAKADGRTLLLISNANAVSASLFKALPYDPVKDFAPVSALGYFDILLLASKDSKFTAVTEMIAFAKANPAKLNIGTISIGSTQHLSAELFISMAGIEAQIIPFRTSTDLLTGLLRNDVQVAFEILAPVLSQLGSSDLIPLAIASARRFPNLPDVPTVEESGVPQYEATSWDGIAAPAGTPKDIIDTINRQIRAALDTPEVKKRFLDRGVRAEGSSPKYLKDQLIGSIAKWRAVIERSNISKQ